MNRAFRIAVAGTHSTGKTSFMLELRKRISDLGVPVEYVHDSATEARDRGFPILAEHTFESTAWLIARAIELETEATLRAEVVLVDRPVSDALGYLHAALAHTRRSLDSVRLDRLDAICATWSQEYDLTFLTVLDERVPLGEGRDPDEVFRRRAAEEVTRIVDRHLPERHLLLFGKTESALDIALRAVLHRGAE